MNSDLNLILLMPSKRFFKSLWNSNFISLKIGYDQRFSPKLGTIMKIPTPIQSRA
jgi:hypothetical protein